MGDLLVAARELEHFSASTDPHVENALPCPPCVLPTLSPMSQPYAVDHFPFLHCCP